MKAAEWHGFVTFSSRWRQDNSGSLPKEFHPFQASSRLVIYFVTGYDSKTHLTMSSMMDELSWRMSGIAYWLAIHALAGRIKFVLTFNSKDWPKTMQKWYGNMFEMEKVFQSCHDLSNRHCQSVHSYIPHCAFAVSIVKGAKVNHLTPSLLLMSGHPLVSDANYNPRGQARRHFVTWDDNSLGAKWGLMVWWLYLGYFFDMFLPRSMVDGRFIRWKQLFFFKTGRSIRWCRILFMTRITADLSSQHGFWDVLLLMFDICCWNMFFLHSSSRL